MRRCGRV